MKRSLTQIATDLGLNLDTLERWIRQGKIPVNKQGDMGIFNESELNRWADKQRKIPMGTDDEGSNYKSEPGLNDPSMSPLYSAMKRGGFFYGVAGENKFDILKNAVDLIPEFSGKNSDEIHAQLMEREKLASTGIGQGIAIPHPRNPLNQGLAESMVVTLFLEKSIDYEALDDRPVFVLFLILSPNVEEHLNLLSRLSFSLRNSQFMAFVKQQPDSKSFLERIKEMETIIDKREIA